MAKRTLKYKVQNDTVNDSKKHAESFNESLQRILDSSQHCVFLDSGEIDFSYSEERAELKQQINNRGLIYIRVKNGNVCASDLLSSMLKSRRTIKTNKPENTSDYRAVCNIIENSPQGIIMIYNADDLDEESTELVSRLGRFMQGTHATWKIILCAKSSALALLNLDKLPLENTPLLNGTKFIDEPDFSTETSGKNLEPALFLGGVVITCTLLFGIFSSESSLKSQFVNNPATNNNTSSINNSEQPLPSDTHDQSNKDSTTEKIELQSNLGLEATNTKIATNNTARVPSESAPTPQQTSKQLTPFDLPVQVTVVKDEKFESIQETLSDTAISIIQSGDLKLVKQTFQNGILINSRDANLQTPLIIASTEGHTEIVEWLTQNSARINLKDEYGRTALYYSAVGGHMQIARNLLANNADINAISKLKKTPLMASVHNNHFEFAALLLSNDANIDIQDHSGWSALFYAAWNNIPAMVSLLLEYDPNLNLLDNSGYTAEAISKTVNDGQALITFQNN